MALDFSILNDLSNGEPAATAPEPAKPRFVFTGPAVSQQKPQQGAQANADKESKQILKQIKAEQGKIITEHIEAQKKSRQLQGEILQGLAKGENMAALLLKALECIARITGEKTFSEAGARYITAIYGKALKEPQALAVTREQLRHRLELLKNARSREKDQREIKLIGTAIEITEREIKELQKD